MTPNQIKQNLNKLVRYKSESLHIDGEFKLSGAVFRKDEKGRFYYQAELQTMNGVIYTALENITEIDSETV